MSKFHCCSSLAFFSLSQVNYTEINSIGNTLNPIFPNVMKKKIAACLSRLLFLSNCIWFYVPPSYTLGGYCRGRDFSENHKEKLTKDALSVGDSVLSKDMLETFFSARGS